MEATSAKSIPLSTLEIAETPTRPLLIRKDEIIGVKKAADFFDLNDTTIRRAVKRYRIARQTQPGAPLQISFPALSMVVHCDFDALERLRAGDRGHPDVRCHFDFVGVPSG